MAKQLNKGLSDLFSDDPELSKSLSGPEIRKACIDELNEHYSWYRRQKNFYAWAWRLATLVVICLSAATTVAIAYGATQSDQGRIVFAIVSATTAALSAIMATFAMQDVWQLRENGRIAVSALLARACLLPVEDQPKALAQAVDLIDEAHKIEAAQSKGHFGFLAQQSENRGRNSGRNGNAGK